MKKSKPLLKTMVLLILFIAASLFLFNTLYPLKHFDLIKKYAKEYGLKPEFVCAVIYTESKFRQEAESPKGASGLMQITEPTAIWLADKMGFTNFDYAEIFDPETNIRIGCYNLNRLLNKYDGDETLSLAAYNAGEGSVRKWLGNEKYSQDGKTLSEIPYKETREYVVRVKNYTKVYQTILKLFGGNND